MKGGVSLGGLVLRLSKCAGPRPRLGVDIQLPVLKMGNPMSAATFVTSLIAVLRDDAFGQNVIGRVGLTNDEPTRPYPDALDAQRQVERWVEAVWWRI